MKKIAIYFIILVGILVACEDVYVPDIDEVENVIVADARIVSGNTNNYISLTESQSFNQDFSEYPAISGGKVALLDNNGNEYNLPETSTGQFRVNIPLLEGEEYKIKIEFKGNIFESGFERVPVLPSLDNVYGIPETKMIAAGGENDADNFASVEGVQLYTNMTSTPENPYYKFTAINTLEWRWVESTEMDDVVHFFWSSYIPSGVFNIAGPPEYSSTTDILKHPLFFFRKSVSLEKDHYMTGWIMQLKQYGISSSAYNYYDDLNNQLDSEGRIFDPVYVQARSNIKCTNNPDEIILGNFEISNVAEHRYFIRYISERYGYKVEEVTDRSTIPWSGETIGVPPDFWVFN